MNVTSEKFRLDENDIVETILDVERDLDAAFSADIWELQNGFGADFFDNDRLRG